MKTETNAYDFHRRVVIGTPVTPKHLLETLAGSSFCVSFAEPRQIERCIELVGEHEILVLDNGAFSIWQADKKGRTLPPRLQFDTQADYRAAFWQWANDIQARSPEAVAVIPDVIEGDEHSNLIECSYAVREGMADYPERVMAIWHLNESLEQLEKLCRLFNFVGFGSCLEYDVQLKRGAYLERIREASAVVDRVEREYGRRPWVHLMRGLGVFSELVRFESADSCNVAVNHGRYKAEHGDNRARYLADRIRAQVADGLEAVEVEHVEAVVSNWHEAPTVRPRLAQC